MITIKIRIYSHIIKIESDSERDVNTCTLYTYKNASSTRNQKWMVFSLLINTHEILNISELIILKLNYYSWFIRIHYNVHLYEHVQVAMSMSATLTLSWYHLKYVWFISLLIKIDNFRKIITNTQPSCLMFVCNSYSICDSYI